MATATAAAVRHMFIAGQWCAAQDGKTVGVINPATVNPAADPAITPRRVKPRSCKPMRPASTGPVTLERARHGGQAPFAPVP